MSSGPVRVTEPTLDVLFALDQADDFELHGWAITKRTLRSGPTVYKILERLTAAGWITARWENLPPEANRPRKRFYALTAEGAVAARSLLAERRPLPALRPAAAIGWVSQA